MKSMIPLATETAWLLGCASCLWHAASAMAAEPQVKLNVDNYDSACGIEISQTDTRVQVVWPLGPQGRGQVVFDLAEQRPLIHSISTIAPDGNVRPIANGLDPVLFVQIGDRDLEKRDGWTIFFDRMQNKPSEIHAAMIEPARAEAASRFQRATLTIGKVSAGPFQGQLRWTFFADNPLVLQEAVVSTERKRTAFLYDMGLVCRETQPRSISWQEPAGSRESESAGALTGATHLAVQGRAVSAGFDGGSIALFPPPHRYFYPLDFSDNLKNVWVGPNYHDQELPFGFGFRHEARGDNRYVPWFNAPPGSRQELGLFLILSADSTEHALQQAASWTRQDRFEPLPGHTVFTSHYHVEHTRELLKAQQRSDESQNSDQQIGRLPSGGQYSIPPEMVSPGFVRVFRDLGINIVHLAEFHYGDAPRWSRQRRLHHLEHLHAECQRLSDDQFLLLPGEEPNVHLGGHWISFFPKPVYWVLNRPDEVPFVEEHPELGRVYHVGGEADVLRLLRAEGGLAWTAHPRIKGSTGYPDRYRNRLFFQSDQFLGGAWKAMPADLSEPRLGARVLDLLDDMSNWGERKFVPGEVDVFQINPDHELYGHMNVNYLRLDRVPRYQDGWESVLDALRQGQFFVTTGEVLIPEFTVNGAESGEVAAIPDGNTAKVRLDLRWTFPLSFAEIIMGNGKAVSRRRIGLSNVGSFGQQTFEFEVDVAGQRWLRVEVWDVATNGAFTQPVRF